MARRCELTGKETQFGHNVSHSNRKTNRRFCPNLQEVTLQSDALRRSVRLRVSTRALRSVQHNGGLDRFLLTTADAKLGEPALRLKRRIKKALASAPSKTAAEA
ncbi:MAG: 50S ribosomal protein L28 [Planctomycetota bacterium]|jgi:large subunit ribosomal protein L28